jgi:23S rRNA (uracil1939-C5)-methyltransferase
VVEISGLATGGDAVGRDVEGAHEGRVTFVPFAAPGERVRALVVKEKSRMAWAELAVVERAAAERIAPPCPLFTRCGGCQWQHVSRSVQLEAKRRMVERALGRIDEMREVGPAYGYRDRVRLTVGRGTGARRAVGFHAWRSREIVDVPACPLLGPMLSVALPRVREWAAQTAPGSEVMVQAGRDGVVARSGSRSLTLLLEAPSGRQPEEGTVDIAEPGSPPLRIPADAFAQVGMEGNVALIAALLEAVGPQPGRILELNAGSGNFTRHLVGVSPEVWASDSDRAAITRGKHLVPKAHWLGPPPWSGTQPASDTVVADPPREGLDPAGLAAAATARERLIYVSCDPQTLGRDARLLGEVGLVLEKVVALDLMPQTYHVEVVATFKRSSAGG